MLSQAVVFFLGVALGLALDYFLVLFMTRELRDRLEHLEKNEKPLRDRVAWLEKHMYRLVRAKLGDEFEGKL